jgi:Zn-dependent alcohol dehydrogenase
MKIGRIEDTEKGWFIGDFSKAIYHSKDFEVSWRIHPSGQVWDIHYQEISTEINLLISGKKIYGSWGGGCKPDIDIPRLTKSFKSGTFPLNKLITKRYSLEQVNEALLDLENGLVFRPLIKMSH